MQNAMKKLLVLAALVLLGTQARAQLSADAGYVHGFEHWKGYVAEADTNLDGVYFGGRYNLDLENILDGLSFLPGANLSLMFGNSPISGMSARELAFNLPLTAAYSYEFTDEFKLLGLAGPEVQFGLMHGISHKSAGTSYDMYNNNNGSGLGYRNRVNLAFQLGIGVEAAERVRVTIGLSLGLLNLNAIQDQRLHRNTLTIGGAYLF